MGQKADIRQPLSSLRLLAVERLFGGDQREQLASHPIEHNPVVASFALPEEPQPRGALKLGPFIPQQRTS
jgi:hypothetical protein